MPAGRGRVELLRHADRGHPSLITIAERCAVVLVASVWPAFVGGLASAWAEGAPTGNAQGLALLARVHRAYERVPAVVTTARFGTVTARFTLLLRSGVAVGEEYVGATPSGTTTLVASGNGLTYAREPGTNCWRRLPASDSQSLEDIGLRFPDAYTTVVGAPRRSGSEWLLPVRTENRSSGEAGAGTMHINATTMLVDRETVRLHGRTLTDHVQALAHQPPLFSPQPLC
jgi:hypothetical protein